MFTSKNDGAHTCRIFCGVWIGATGSLNKIKQYPAPQWYECALASTIATLHTPSLTFPQNSSGFFEAQHEKYALSHAALFPFLERSDPRLTGFGILCRLILDVLPAVWTVPDSRMHLRVRMTSGERAVATWVACIHINVANIWISHVRVEDLQILPRVHIISFFLLLRYRIYVYPGFRSPGCVCWFLSFVR